MKGKWETLFSIETRNWELWLMWMFVNKPMTLVSHYIVTLLHIVIFEHSMIYNNVLCLSELLFRIRWYLTIDSENLSNGNKMIVKIKSMIEFLPFFQYLKGERCKRTFMGQNETKNKFKERGLTDKRDLASYSHYSCYIALGVKNNLASCGHATL